MAWPGPVYFPELLPGEWDETEHPRHPRGTSRGGRFREKAVSSASGADRWVQASLTGIGIDLGEDELRDVLARGREVARAPLHGGTVGTTAVVAMEMPDGLRVAVVHKRQDPEYSDLEVWSSRIGRAIGAPVPAVIHDPDDEDSVYMSYIQGHAALHRALDISADTGDDEYGILDDLTAEHVGTRRGALLGLLDVALLNADRHGGNWVIDHENQVWGIDHTHIRPWSEDDYGEAGYEDFGMAVHQGETSLTTQDFMAAKAQIQRLVDDGRIPAEWWPPMSARLDRLRRSLQVAQYSFPGGVTR